MTVVIPTYNRADLLPLAIRSVLDQTLPDVEVVVVDDGSTDETPAALEPFLSAVSVIRTENRGVSHARNVGMRAARAKYVAFLDSDDLYLPHKLALQVAFMEAHPEAGFVSTEVSSLVDGRVVEEYHLRSFHKTWDWQKWSYDDLYPVQGTFDCAAVDAPVPYYVGPLFRFVLQGTLIMSNTVLFRREILERAGYQNEAYRFAEDYEWLVRVCKQYEAAFLNIPTYLYRYHGDQVTKLVERATRDRLEVQIEIETVVILAILDWGYGDETFRAENSGWMDGVLAGKYRFVGEKWLEYSDAVRARASFRGGMAFEPAGAANHRLWLLTFLPPFLRRALLAVAWRVGR